MDNAEVFWSDVHDAVSELVVDVAKQQLQPKEGVQRDSKTNKWPKTGGAVYMTSVANRAAKEHKPGVVTLMSYFLAAQRKVEGLHKLSTDDEIRAYQGAEKIKRDEILGAGARARNVQQFNVVPPVMEVSK